jgi:hypothetical protein
MLGFRIIFAAHPDLLGPVLRIIHQVYRVLSDQPARLKRNAADTSAVTRIHRTAAMEKLE